MRTAYPIPNVRGGYALGADLPGTPVDLKLLFWGVSLFVVGAYLLGGGEPQRPLRARKAKGAPSGVAQDAISALQNLGYGKNQARLAVQAAQRQGHRSFDAIFDAAQGELS